MLSAQENGQGELYLPARPQPNRWGSIPIADNTAPRLLLVVCSLPASSETRLCSWVGRGVYPQLFQPFFGPSGELQVGASSGSTFLPARAHPAHQWPDGGHLPGQLQGHSPEAPPWQAHGSPDLAAQAGVSTGKTEGGPSSFLALIWPSHRSTVGACPGSSPLIAGASSTRLQPPPLLQTGWGWLCPQQLQTQSLEYPPRSHDQPRAHTAHLQTRKKCAVPIAHQQLGLLLHKAINPQGTL